MKTWLVYKHTLIADCEHKGWSYIGITCQTLSNRWKNGTGYPKAIQPILYKAIKKYGWDNFTHEVIEENIDTLDKANEREKYWIAYYHTWIYDPVCRGYNNTQGGDGNPWHTVSKEARQKMGSANKGRPGPFKGQHLSEEHKKHLSESHKGKTHIISEETKQKIREKSTGRLHSQKTKLKISLAKKGQIPWNKGRSICGHSITEKTKQKISISNGKPILMLDKNTHKILQEFVSTCAAARYISELLSKKVQQTLICRVARENKLKTAYGFCWQYKENYIV